MLQSNFTEIGDDRHVAAHSLRRHGVERFANGYANVELYQVLVHDRARLGAQSPLTGIIMPDAIEE
jgi:hypothetical protein